MSFSSVGKVWDRLTFREYLKTQDLSWAKGGVCIHHTAMPDMDMRPTGWTIQHMRNIQSFYIRTYGWDRGPHFFTDRDEIYGMSPVSERSIHAVSFNAHYVSIEMLGHFDHSDDDDPTKGRGLEIINMSAMAAAQILIRMGKTPSADTIKFHRDDPKTSKTCPGQKISKEWFLERVQEAYGLEVKVINGGGDRVDPPVEPPASPPSPLLDSLKQLRVLVDKVIKNLGG